MKKYLISGLVLVFLVTGLKVAGATTIDELSAQIEYLLQQISALKSQQNTSVTPGVSNVVPPTNYNSSNGDSSGGSAPECLNLKYNLYFGLGDAQTNGEVSKLQKFLQWTNDYEYPTITGYFGPATEAAVKRFQAKYNIVSSGSPDTTGWGAVGPKTAKVIKDLSCKGSSGNNQGSPSLTITFPNSGGIWTKGYEYQVLWQKTSVSSSKELKLSLVRADNGNEILLKTGVDNDLKANVKVPVDIAVGAYYVKILGIVDGVVVSDMSDQPIQVQDAAPGEGTLTASPLTVLSGQQTTVQFSNAKSEYFKLAFDCPSLVSVYVGSDVPGAQNFCGIPYFYAGKDGAGTTQGTLVAKFNSSASSEQKVKVTLWGYTLGADKIANTADDVSLGSLKSLSLTVVPPFTSAFNITSPNGGEVWEQGSSQTVTWEKTNISSSKEAKLFLEHTNGIQYVLKTGVENDLKTTVIVPKDILVGSYKLIIQATVDGIIVKDSSDGYISVVAPNTTTPKSVTVLSPNGGEMWNIGDTKTISWKFLGYPSTDQGKLAVQIQLLSGQSTTPFQGLVGVPCVQCDTTVSGGSYTWSVGKVLDSITGGTKTVDPGSYKIQVNAVGSVFGYDPGYVIDLGDGSFTINQQQTQTPSITVISPNGGETITFGKEFLVSWSSVNIPSGQLVTIVADNLTTGINGYTLAYQTANDGTEKVSLPSIAPPGSYKARIYTMVNGVTISDASDAPFNISQNPSTIPSFTVESPNGGEAWIKGTAVTTKWSSQNISSEKKIDLYLKNVSDNKEYPFALSVYNDGKTTAPKVSSDVPAGQYKFVVRTTIDNLLVSDESNAPFTILDKAAITSFTATDPTLNSIHSVNLTWSASVPVTGTIEAQCVADSIKLLVNNSPYPCNYTLGNYYNQTTGATLTVVPQNNTKSVSVDFILKTKQGSMDLDNKKVTVVFPATTQGLSLNLLSPNGGETYEYGKNFTVTWSTENIAASQWVTIVADNVTTGATGYTLAYQTPNDGTQSVSLPTVAPAGMYKVRIYTTLLDKTLTDTSDGTINITQNVALTITSPNGGETWAKGVTQKFYWTDTNIAGTKLIDFYLVNQTTGTTYVLVKGKANDGLGQAKIDADTPSGTYKLRATTIVDGIVISDESDGAITVTAPSASTPNDNAEEIAALLKTFQSLVQQLQALLGNQQ